MVYSLGGPGVDCMYTSFAKSPILLATMLIARWISDPNCSVTALSC